LAHLMAALAIGVSPAHSDGCPFVRGHRDYEDRRGKAARILAVVLMGFCSGICCFVGSTDGIL